MAGLTPVELAKALRRTQAFVSKRESGERRTDSIDLVDFARPCRKSVTFFLRDA